MYSEKKNVDLFNINTIFSKMCAYFYSNIVEFNDSKHWQRSSKSVQINKKNYSEYRNGMPLSLI